MARQQGRAARVGVGRTATNAVWPRSSEVPVRSSSEKRRSMAKQRTRLGRAGLACALAAAALMVCVCDVRAQQPSGLIGGFSLGGGMLGIDRVIGGDSIAGRDGGVPVAGVGIYVGHMLDEKTAGILVVTGAVGDFGDVVEAAEFDVFGVAVQRWLASNVWVRGGAGYGAIESTDPTAVEFNMNGSDIGWLAGAGVGVWRRRNFAADVGFHFVGAWGDRFRVRAPTVQLGLNWY